MPLWVPEIPQGLLDAKGDLIAASAGDVAARLAVGSNGHVLTADSAEAVGVKWAAAAGGGGDAPTTMFSNIFAPQSPLDVASAFTTSANRGHFSRVEAPKSGDLADLAVYIFTSAGNISVALYDSHGTTMNRLYTTGAIACPAGSGWKVVGAGSLGVSVTKGTQYFLLVSTDSASTGFGHYGAFAGGDASDLPANFLSSGTKVAGLDNSLHPAPATYSTGSMAPDLRPVAVMARIT